MHRLKSAALAACGLLAAPAHAGDLPQKTATAVVFGNDPCPKGAPDEIVVCARKPENERYRIPKALRQQRREDPVSTSWASHWAGVEEATRYTRPNSCSVVGSFGQTGCTQAMLRQWWAERRAAAAATP